MDNDERRAKLYITVREQWGEEAAATVMAVLPPWDHSEVARRQDLENLRVAMEARFDQVDARFEATQARVDAKLDQQFARFLMWQIPLMGGLSGLVLAAARLA